jgi:hypothetical protein
MIVHSHYLYWFFILNSYFFRLTLVDVIFVSYNDNGFCSIFIFFGLMILLNSLEEESINVKRYFRTS